MIGAHDHSSVGIIAVGRVKGVQGSQLAAERHFEDGATAIDIAGRIVASGVGGAVEISVGRLDDGAGRVLTVSAAALRTKVVQRSQCSAGGDGEEGAGVGGPASVGGTVEVAVRGQQQRTIGRGAVISSEAVERG